MIRAFMAAWVIAASASCSAPISDMPLAGLDLNNARVVDQIAGQLPASQRATFVTYVLVHWPGSKNYCGHAISRSGQTAKTVGEAIKQTLIFEIDEANIKQSPQVKPTSRVDQLQERDLRITDQIEEIVLRRDALYTRLGRAARRSHEQDSLEQEMRHLQTLRAVVQTQLAQERRRDDGRSTQRS